MSYISAEPSDPSNPPVIDREMMTIARIMAVILRYPAGREAKLRVLQYVMDRLRAETSE